MKRFALIAMLALAACETTPGVVTQTPTATPGSSATAEPGPKSVSAQAAAALFQSVCVNSKPNFKTAVNQLNSSYVRSTKTGTYFSKASNLSFKINADGKANCSMVFQSNSKAKQITAAFKQIGQSSALRTTFAASKGYFSARIGTR